MCFPKLMNFHFKKKKKENVHPYVYLPSPILIRFYFLHVINFSYMYCTFVNRNICELLRQPENAKQLRNALKKLLQPNNNKNNKNHLINLLFSLQVLLFFFLKIHRPAVGVSVYNCKYTFHSWGGIKKFKHYCGKIRPGGG